MSWIPPSHRCHIHKLRAYAIEVHSLSHSWSLKEVCWKLDVGNLLPLALVYFSTLSNVVRNVLFVARNMFHWTVFWQFCVSFPAEFSDFAALSVFSHNHFCCRIINAELRMSKFYWHIFTSHKANELLSGLNKMAMYLMRNSELFFVSFFVFHFFEIVFKYRINYLEPLINQRLI